VAFRECFAVGQVQDPSVSGRLLLKVLINNGDDFCVVVLAFLYFPGNAVQVNCKGYVL
jgi:hypothetical protein